MAIKYVPVGGNDQAQVVVDPPTEKELNDAAEVKQEGGSSRSVGKVVPADRALIDNAVDIDKYHQNRVAHKGFIEKPIALKSEATYERTTVTLDNGEEIEAWAYVAPEERDIIANPYAATKDTKTVKSGGTFTVSSGENSFGPFDNTKYNNDADVADEENELIQPIPALAADEEQMRELDTHWRNGEDLVTPIDNENYLSRPGAKIKTSETFLAQE